MDSRLLEKQAVQLIMDCCSHNLSASSALLDDNILWIGPHDGQFVRGKRAMIDAIAAQKNRYQYSVRDMHILTQPMDPHVCSQVLFIETYMTDSTGSGTVHKYIFDLLWKEKQIRGESVTRIMIMHMAETDGTEEQISSVPLRIPADQPSAARRLITIRTSRSRSACLPSSSVFWVEASDKGKHTLFHTEKGVIKSIDSLAPVASKNSGALLRCHARFLINPLYIREIRRFSVTMADGAEIPIPAKKYKSVRETCLAWLQRFNHTGESLYSPV